MTDQTMTPVTDYETAAERCKAELRLWLRLLSCTNLIENAVRARLRETFDVTLPQFDLMAALEREPDGLTMGELSRRLMVSSGNVTGVTERLVAEGLVVREPSPSDRRAFLVKLTPAGRRAFLAMAMVHEGWIADFFDDLPGEDVEALMALLAKVKRAVHAKTRNGKETA
ncbi:MarR family transcriptional regulator [Azospirillum sp. TSO22-1]|uniref:MarR family winged helix-turn-helix transcriptional regulator n=1 Tax=Azospirillum sp. TSO22-1 TaxID=716789 RepID=UPI001FFED0F5|nr:MarR family transcriptional regulator [Azospirillum sp. TSO22-1]